MHGDTLMHITYSHAYNEASVCVSHMDPDLATYVGIQCTFIGSSLQQYINPQRFRFHKLKNTLQTTSQMCTDTYLVRLGHKDALRLRTSIQHMFKHTWRKHVGHNRSSLHRWPELLCHLHFTDKCMAAKGNCAVSQLVLATCRFPIQHPYSCY